MNDTDKIKALAELDGFTWTTDKDSCWCWLRPDGFFTGKRLFPADSDMNLEALPPYLTSRDAIVPVIKKHWKDLLNVSELKAESFLVTFGEWCEKLCHDEVEWTMPPVYRYFLMKPEKICEVLLRATGKWKE